MWAQGGVFQEWLPPHRFGLLGGPVGRPGCELGLGPECFAAPGGGGVAHDGGLRELSVTGSVGVQQTELWGQVRTSRDLEDP